MSLLCFRMFKTDWSMSGTITGQHICHMYSLQARGVGQSLLTFQSLHSTYLVSLFSFLSPWIPSLFFLPVMFVSHWNYFLQAFWICCGPHRELPHCLCELLICNSYADRKHGGNERKSRTGREEAEKREFALETQWIATLNFCILYRLFYLQ